MFFTKYPRMPSQLVSDITLFPRVTRFATNCIGSLLILPPHSASCSLAYFLNYLTKWCSVWPCGGIPRSAGCYDIQNVNALHHTFNMTWSTTATTLPGKKGGPGKHGMKSRDGGFIKTTCPPSLIYFAWNPKKLKMEKNTWPLSIYDFPDLTQWSFCSDNIPDTWW